MAIKLVVSPSQATDETRVLVVPQILSRLQALGIEISLPTQAGMRAGYPDLAYAGNCLAKEQVRVQLVQADIILALQMPSLEEIATYKPGAVLVGLLTPWQQTQAIQALAAAQVTTFALEWLPRITRAQSMDVLSSQACVAGYQAVLLAAQRSIRFFPMLTTAAGTIRPATVLVIGAGVAGLQAIATAKRLGAKVYAYDVRASVKEQIASLGAQMIDTGVSGEGQGGYARELTSAEQAQQQAVLREHIAKADVVISTAAIPGRAAPRIIDKAMVESMAPGSLIVDLAASTGGNCELTQAGQAIEHQHVTVYGPLNLASELAQHASDMLSRNVYEFLKLIVNAAVINLDWTDAILLATRVTHAGQVYALGQIQTNTLQETKV